MSDPIRRKDLTELYDQTWKQMLEDREMITKAYNDLKNHTQSREDYAITGLVLSKFAELCLKQTGQMVEIIRINQKETNKEEVELDADDKKEIYKEIGN